MELLIEVTPKVTTEDDLPTTRGGFGSRATTAAVEAFETRAAEIAEAIRTVGDSMRSQFDKSAGNATEQRWSLDQVEMGLDLTLEAGAGVVISRASAGATLSAKLTWTRHPDTA